jgi:chemotaxis protein methyltransferase CheR
MGYLEQPLVLKATITLAAGNLKLRREEFNKIRGLAEERFGLDLKPGKEELVLARLGRVLRDGGFTSFDDYYQYVVRDQTGDSLTTLIDALTTNFTSFFRGADHFDFLKTKIVPALRKRPKARLWCAAAATGEEPFSIVFTLLEAAGMAAASKVQVVATDISTRALAVAKRGVYADDRFAGVPEAVRRRYLLRGHEAAEGYYKVRPEIQRCVEFRRLNLIEKISHPESFPVIFCRNVMIYFNQETRHNVVNQLIDWLEPGGYLFVGHSESLNSRDFALDYVQPAIYQKPADSVWRRRQKGGHP